MMRCAGCSRELEIGDQYIEAPASVFAGKKAAPEIDALIADVFGGNAGQIIYCEDCTEKGGDFRLQTYWGEDDDG